MIKNGSRFTREHESCPCCLSDNCIKGTFANSNTDYADVYKLCTICGFKWIDSYEYTHSIAKMDAEFKEVDDADA